MTTRLRICALALLASAIVTGSAGVASAGELGVSLWEAGTCSKTFNCTYKSVEADHAEAFTQAAGHPAWGITTFELSHSGTFPLAKPEGEPLKRVRVDVPQGLASNPQAPAKCKIEAFMKNACLPTTEVGTQEAIVWTGLVDVELTGPTAGHVYNLEPEPGTPIPGGSGTFQPMPLLFGIQIATEHSFLEGHVAWWSDYHEYFEINNLGKSAPVLKSKLNFNGHAGGNFLTLPSECTPVTTTYLEVESWTGEHANTFTHPPLGIEGCGNVPFGLGAEVTPGTSQADQPDGATTEVKVPQKANPEEINTADIKDAHVTLPEGLTLNPSAAHGLEACSPSQIGIGTTNPVACPAGSEVGTVTIETDLPEKSLTGKVFLGAPSGVPITGPPFTIYVDAEAPAFGVSVRLQGQVNPNPTTGRLEASFANNPQLPFSAFILSIKPGPRSSLANPLTCGPSSTDSVFTPWTGLAAAAAASPFAAGGCPASTPFVLGQGTQDAPNTGGAYASYTLNLARADGQQYLSQVRTVLPAGLVGEIPTVTQCGEPQAQAGSCPPASQIGVANVKVGAGSEPYEFQGPVYFTGPYNGAPFGLSIPVEAAAGPFDLGRVVTRAAISVDPYSGRVIATSSLPTIVKGIPLRLRDVSVVTNRPHFLMNPTNCGPLTTDSSLTSTFLATQPLSSPFQVSGCNALAFKPSFAAASNARANKAAGAALQVNVTQPAHQANIRSVLTQLPLQLPSRLTTLQKACLEATFAANPFSCPEGSNVGSATAVTPTLATPLKGPAYLVSHGGAAFPDLEIVLEGSGVRVILVGNTDIKHGITTSNFAAIPDVPVTSFSLNLPMGPHSVLGVNGSLCARPLVMPTTITAQNGAQIKQNTKIAVAGCPIKILRRRISHHVLILTVQTFGAGRLTVTGKNLKTARRSVRRATTTTIRVRLSSKGTRALRTHRRMKIRVRVRFAPSVRGESASAASTSVTFKR
ncbi:MAG TPA: hypothetical protein VHY83_08980 [Solirubrobacteraceae bacterium]|jgi:hypothetical protein|nr:hypothetical protein [Solirubrobacteraceae bacterium]